MVTAIPHDRWMHGSGIPPARESNERISDPAYAHRPIAVGTFRQIGVKARTPA
jgi:hypothetical protein